MESLLQLCINAFHCHILHLQRECNNLDFRVFSFSPSTQYAPFEGILQLQFDLIPTSNKQFDESVPKFADLELVKISV